MTLGSTHTDSGRITRRVSATMTPSSDMQNSSPRKRSRPSNSLLTRQVSHEALAGISDGGKENDTAKPGVSCRGSPVHCVSEFDKVATVNSPDMDEPPSPVPPLPNPLHNRYMLERHTQALRLEAELHPMRLIVSRLMAHPTHNRKGIFNTPVDPVALGLPDYFSVISKPMDLGTIKARLHAVAYKSRSDVADDIRLVFENAMKYNPPHNAVNASARELLAFFEEQVRAFVPELAVQNKPAPMKDAPVSSVTGTVVSAESQKAGSAAPDKNIKRTVSSEPDAEAQPAGVVPSAAHSTTAGKARSLPIATQATRKSTPAELLSPSVMMTARKRKKRGSKVNPSHSCQWCEGRTCSICQQGCLQLEPTLLICNGPNCAGAKIRKGATYFIAKDGSRQFCQRCYTGLPAVLPSHGHEDACRYKRDLLKRKSDEEVVEHWLSCSKCSNAVHQVCVLHNEYVHSGENYLCPSCVSADSSHSLLSLEAVDSSDQYTFVTGSDFPVKLSEVAGESFRLGQDVLSSDALRETPISCFIQRKVRERMESSDCPNAEKTIVVRIISDCSRYFKVPEVVRKHFRMACTPENRNESSTPPLQVNYRSKAIALFQKVDGLDVCIFCMYVQEYDGHDVYECKDKEAPTSAKRVYIAYLDSVEHFRPRPCRTSVYHEMLVAYLATARQRGYETAHIWACPPSRGNSFVFWNHPASQRTPNRERLISWYHGALSRALECGVVTDVNSLYETAFQQYSHQVSDVPVQSAGSSIPGPMLCPPLLDGDFWIEEAARIHGINIARYLKSRIGDGDSSIPAPPIEEEGSDRCPALQVAGMLRERIIANPSAVPFRRPVNAAALNLKDYHDIISNPLDLGTVYSQCMLGEYRTLGALVSDVDLVFSNATRYNPKGHFVHTKAIEMRALFFVELNNLTKTWCDSASCGDICGPTWEAFADLSMSLDMLLDDKKLSSLDDQRLSVGQSVAVALEPEPAPSATAENCAQDAEKRAKSPEGAQLLTGGPDAVLQRMVGNDTWLLDKRPLPPKGSGLSKKTGGRRRRSSVVADDEPAPKRRRQSWLGEEVAAAVRRMRTSFFTCSLVAKPSMSKQEGLKVDEFTSYIDQFKTDNENASTSGIADARHALLEFSQYRNLEFDTLRRAKYSTAILLYHLHNDRAPGMVPVCSACNREIEDVRWHKVGKVVERKRGGRMYPPVRKPVAAASSFKPEELCTECHAKHSHGEQFIPLQVSFRS